MRHGSLFSGIGGFDLAAEWAGWANVFHCEINPFCQKVLKHYWPDAETFTDITKTDFSKYEGTIDIISGGFPCQPYSISMAGKRLGKEDDRHLWPFMLDAIRAIKPRWVVGENVRGLANWSEGLVFEEVHTDLEAAGYEVQAFILPAASVNAPHRRDRIWFVAQNAMFGRRVHGGDGQEGAEVWQQRNAGTGDTVGICGEKVAGPTPNANNSRGGAGLGQVSKEDGKVSERHENAEFGNAGSGPTSNTDDTRLQERRQNNGQKYSAKNESALHDRIEQPCDNGPTPNANSDQRPEGWLRTTGREKAERHAGMFDAHGNGRTAWENFPTQSPVCSGDDGLPTELDGVTFSKWRNESIKAYGNAVVPQVVFEIFSAINEYEAMTNKH